MRSSYKADSVIGKNYENICLTEMWLSDAMQNEALFLRIKKSFGDTKSLTAAKLSAEAFQLLSGEPKCRQNLAQPQFVEHCHN